MLPNGGVAWIHPKRGTDSSYRALDLVNFVTGCARIARVSHRSIRIDPRVDCYIVAPSLFDKRRERIVTGGRSLCSRKKSAPRLERRFVERISLRPHLDH